MLKWSAFSYRIYCSIYQWIISFSVRSGIYRINTAIFFKFKYYMNNSFIFSSEVFFRVVSNRKGLNYWSNIIFINIILTLFQTTLKYLICILQITELLDMAILCFYVLSGQTVWSDTSCLPYFIMITCWILGIWLTYLKVM